jgi:hypothetical protein
MAGGALGCGEARSRAHEQVGFGGRDQSPCVVRSPSSGSTGTGAATIERDRIQVRMYCRRTIEHSLSESK